MKKSVLTSYALLLLLTATAAPKRFKLLTSTTNWGNTANWAPTGKPQNGDTVFIPENMQLTLSSDLTLKNVYFDLFGSLVLSGNSMKLNMENASTMNVHTGGSISGTKASQQVVLNSIIYKGNSPVLTGPIIATSTSNGFAPYVEFTILPVKFMSFTVMRGNNNVIVQWSTTEEINAAYYEVQRSTDGRTWTSVSRLQAASNPTNTYAYHDKNMAAGKVQYRIRQVDTDGSATFTSVCTISNTMAATPLIFSGGNNITVRFQQVVKGPVLVEVIGANGYVALQQKVAEWNGTLQLPTALKGIHVVRITNGHDLNFAKQVLL